MTTGKIREILVAHGKWLRGEAGGTRANLARADLAGADLAGANLADADLAGANLARANLADADLAGANLARANLARADLAGADLAGANLADADLAGANLARANLADADLAGANLARANLADAYLAGANLADAYLAGADGMPVTGYVDPPEPYTRTPDPARYARRAARYRAAHPEVPVIEAIDAKILDTITIGGGHLEMGSWHSCETTHCRAGWAITLGGDAGRELERRHGPHRAGTMIYRASTGRVPHFFATNERAMEDLRERAAEQAAGAVLP